MRTAFMCALVSLITFAGHSQESKSFIVSWQPISGAVAYRLEERTVSGAWSEIHRGGQTTITLAGRSPEPLEFRVRACYADGSCGAYVTPSLREATSDKR